MVGGLANFVCGATVWGFFAADQIPPNGSFHCGDEDFSDFDLVGESEACWIVGEGRRGFGDVANKSTCVVLFFAADGRISVGDYGEGDYLIYVCNEREVYGARLDEEVTVQHCDASRVVFLRAR